MSDFLLELRSEEIPARMQAGARKELEKLFRREMDAAGVSVGDITVWSTPRRLALIARDLPDATEPVSEEAKGPPEGAPDQAVEGFCRKTGVTRDELEVREVKGRATYFAIKNIPGRSTSVLLAEAIPAIVRDFSWPKSMRWGAASISTESLRWVRPLSGIVALLGDDVVECEVHGVLSGAVTLGHRFHHSGDITIGNAADYAVKLRAGHVIVDHEERQALIRRGAAKIAEEAGLKLVEDEGLVIENAGLTEWPVPLLGRFEEEFLTVPPEVIQLTARVNQKYFVCESPLPHAGGVGGGPSADQASPTPNPSREREGDVLANAFVCTANIEAEDGGTRVVEGNRKVLAARLADARFFWDVDRKKTLAEHAKSLERITFHEKLGTVADKVERVAKLAEWLATEGIVPDCDPKLARQAAKLCKADLVTEMVGEFPELQGVMGGYYARAEGVGGEHNDIVADAIRDHYKPVGQGDDVPTAPVTVAVSFADKLDTLVSFFAIDEAPTGSKDPFALRRAALAVLSLIQKNELRVQLLSLIGHANAASIMPHIQVLMQKLPMTMDEIYEHRRRVKEEGYTGENRPIFKSNEAEQSVALDLLDSESPLDERETRLYWTIHRMGGLRGRDEFDRKVMNFFADRLKVQQREAGVRHDLIDAVFALGGEDDLVRLLARVKALQSFMETDDGANLLAGYKRAANILKKEDWRGIEGEIPQTGEEDPLALVDDPGMKDVIAAKMREKHAAALSYTPEKAEKALIDALEEAEPRVTEAIDAEDFTAAMSALASLRAPIDAFFEEVTVNDDDPAKRAQRLDLLARFREAVHCVADFSKIEGG